MGVLRRFKTYTNVWTILSTIIILLIVIPNINILMGVFKEANDNWDHIKKYLLQDYINNSLILIFSAGFLTILIGVSLAWLISVYDFTLRRFFKWALILPLAIPPYIAAYTYTGLLNYTGVVQTFLRNNFNILVNQKYFNMMSMKGAIFIFSMFLFPYVYIITKSFLQKQSASLIENARVLGRSPLEIFFHVALPISRGAIIGGVSLVILEILNDYGVVKYFGIPTFSTAIFKTWFAMGDLDSAVRLASILMILVLVILIIEKILRGRRKYSYTTSKVRPISRIRLKGIKNTLALIYCLLIFSLGFVIPALQLTHWSFLTYEKILNPKFWKLIFNSLSIALITSIIIILFATIIANNSRISNSWVSKIKSKATLLGYSIPGAVISVGVIVFFIGIDNNLFWLYKLFNENSAKLVLSTSIVMLIFAYTIRFMAIGYNPIEAGFEKVGTKFTEASRTLGMNLTQTFFKVDLKMIKHAILSGFVLVFVDILKELPLTLILRPFNFNTLATKAFEYANDEMIHEASISSLIIIIISFVSIYFFYKVADKEG